jgi:hypothetical protein
MQSAAQPLTRSDLQSLEKSWITGETAAAAGLFRVDNSGVLVQIFERRQTEPIFNFSLRGKHGFPYL